MIHNIGRTLLSTFFRPIFSLFDLCSIFCVAISATDELAEYMLDNGSQRAGSLYRKQCLQQLMVSLISEASSLFGRPAYVGRP